MKNSTSLRLFKYLFAWGEKVLFFAPHSRPKEA